MIYCCIFLHAEARRLSPLNELGFDYIICFRACIEVEATCGWSHAAARWVPLNGLVKTLPGAKVTADKTEVPVVVCIKAKGMKERVVLGLEPRRPDRRAAGKLARHANDLRFGLSLS